MAQSITLTASMRSNLSSLKGIQKQMDTTQERLSTGKKVNSAIDNASSFYQSRSLTNRAADLGTLLDSMGQGIQTIQAANEGIEAVTAFVDQLKSVATSAYAAASGGADSTTIRSYQEQYNSILSEVKTLIEDSGYQGINLLNGGKLTVIFDENREHTLGVQGDVLTTQLNTKSAAAFSWDAEGKGSVDWGINTSPTFKSYTEVTLKPTAVTEGQDLDGLYEWDNVGKNWKAATTEVAEDKTAAESNYFVINEDVASETKFATAPAGTAATGTAATRTATMATDIAATAEYYDERGATRATLINDALDGISTGLDYLRDYTSKMGNNYSIIQTRQDFTESLIDVLETGSDNLVLADMNEESANYLALQTRQQLAINSLSLASQSAQSVLKLF